MHDACKINAQVKVARMCKCCVQLATFRTIQGATANPLTYNHRPVQALNGRTVSYYPDNGATSSTVASLSLLSVTSALVLLLKN